MSAAYIKVHFRQNFIMEANNMDTDMQVDLGPYCLPYTLPKNVSRREEQTTKVVTGLKRFSIAKDTKLMKN